MANRKISNSTLECGNQQQLSIGGGGSYEIKVLGHLDGHWSGWLGGLAVVHDGKGYTLLTGHIPDQAALHGVLVKIRDLGLPLMSLRYVANNQGREELS